MIENKNIPAMTPEIVHEYLYGLGIQWSGKGVAMELGCWLGATSVPLLRGLVSAGYDKPFWAFDRWWVNEEQMKYAESLGFKLSKGQNSSKIYLENVKAVYEQINAIRCELPGGLTNYMGEPIEILILDAPKRNPVFRNCMEYLLPYCIPGVTVIGLLDYHYWERRKGKQRQLFKAPIQFMEKYKDHFTLLEEWKDQCSCAFFKYEKQMTWEKI